MLDYPEVYFLGLEAKKLDGGSGASQNNGYDDENGSYIKVMVTQRHVIWTPLSRCLSQEVSTE